LKKIRGMLDQPGAPKPDTAQEMLGATKITYGVNTP
jgi:hypothetical protein